MLTTSDAWRSSAGNGRGQTLRAKDSDSQNIALRPFIPARGLTLNALFHTKRIVANAGCQQLARGWASRGPIKTIVLKPPSIDGHTGFVISSPTVSDLVVGSIKAFAEQLRLTSSRRQPQATGSSIRWKNDQFRRARWW